MKTNFTELYKAVTLKVSPPSQLSDPDGDFQYPEDCRWREETVKKSVTDLSLKDFQIIFQSVMPAGTFEECLYYYPFALERFFDTLTEAREKDINADLLDNLLAWTAQNHKRLDMYGLFHISLKCILDIYVQLFMCNRPMTCECLLEVSRFLRNLAKLQWYNLSPLPPIPCRNVNY